MKSLIQQFGLIATIILVLTSLASAEFVHNVDMFGDYNQYLHSTTNAEVWHEHWGSGWHVDYWAPIEHHQWAEIVYKYDLPFSITEATVFGRTYVSPNYPDAEAYLDVSPDGNAWTNIIAGCYGNDPIDISYILSGSNTAYVRARLYHEYTGGSYRPAQFMRSDIAYPLTRAPNVYEFRAVPEPVTLSIFAFGILAMLRRRKLN